MYNFLYIFFYRLFEKVKTVDPRDNATSIVLIAIFFHSFLALSAINYFTGINVLVSVFGEGHSKYLWLPVILIVMFFAYRTFKRKSEILIPKYKEKRILTIKNTILVTLIILFPLLLGMMFLSL